jgi:hypothetical protein
MLIFVFFHSHAQMQGAQNFCFAQLFRSLRSTLSFVVRSPPRSILLSQNYFFSRSFFSCRPVSSAQKLCFDFFVAHGISAVHFFRILRQKFEFLASSLCCFWLSDHTGQNQLNWPMGAVEPVLRTSSTAYIYDTPLLFSHSFHSRLSRFTTFRAFSLTHLNRFTVSKPFQSWCVVAILL